MKNLTGLSCVEFIIITVILGIVVVEIGPAVTEAREEAKVSRLIDGLERIRANLDLYRVQHEGSLPPVDSFAGFQAAMTTKCGRYGPYIKKIPTNPFNHLNTVRFDGEPAGVRKAGWRLDTKRGLFQADHEADYAAL